jgi:ATP-dependent Clp protease ATP-binding subunit ClpX
VAKRLGKGIIGFDTEQQDRAFDATETNYLLSKVETEDLIQFGLIPEFVGRFNSLANCNELTLDDLVEILVKPKNAIIGQYQRLFTEDGVDLSFTEDALKAIAAKAKKSDTGARALRMIVETLLMDLMYEVPSDPTVKQVHIEEECVTDDKPPTIKRSNEKTG